MPGSPTLKTCSPALRRYAWSLLRNTAEANDLVQDYLLRAPHHMESLREDRAMHAWPFGIMHNQSISRWRRRRKRGRVMVDDPDGRLSAGVSQLPTKHMPNVLKGLGLWLRTITSFCCWLLGKCWNMLRLP
jgi:RNA polymerase sigma factor (sigma-70 family)